MSFKADFNPFARSIGQVGYILRRNMTGKILWKGKTELLKEFEKYRQVERCNAKLCRILFHAQRISRKHRTISYLLWAIQVVILRRVSNVRQNSNEICTETSILHLTGFVNECQFTFAKTNTYWAVKSRPMLHRRPKSHLLSSANEYNQPGLD